MLKKANFTYDEIHKIIEESAANIKSLNLDCMVAIGGGGFIPGRMLRSYLKLPLYSVTMKLYGESDEINGTEPVIFQWIDKYAENSIRGKNILIVDEIDDSRLTLDYCVRKIRELEPKSITIYVIHSKEKEKLGKLDNDVKLFAGQMIKDVWINYPWESINILEHIAMASETDKNEFITASMTIVPN